MDEFNIYANVKRPSGNTGKTKRSREHSYDYENETQLEPNKTDAALSGDDIITQTGAYIYKL